MAKCSIERRTERSAGDVSALNFSHRERRMGSLRKILKELACEELFAVRVKRELSRL